VTWNVFLSDALDGISWLTHRCADRASAKLVLAPQFGTTHGNSGLL